MPTYEFRCEACGMKLEIFISMDERATPKCMGCEIPMSRVWSATPVIFKGSGFYTNDSK